MSQSDNKDEHKIAAEIARASHNNTFTKKQTEKCAAISKMSNDSQLPSTSKQMDALAASTDALHLTPSSSDENTRKSWIKARDSLETIPKTPENIVSSKSTSCTRPNEKLNIAASSPLSESLIGKSKKSSCSVSKVLAWDPWDRLSRKSKKENKRRKSDKTNEPSSSASSTPKEKDTNRKDYKSGDEALRQQLENQQPAEASYDEYAYQPYQKTMRSVEFINKVMVVYINKEDKVVGEASEPLKKEQEQQIRNKEMRRGHMPDVTFLKRNVMSEWMKK